MVDVNHEDQIHRLGGQFRIGERAEDGLDVGEFACRRAFAENVEHLFLNVHGVDLALGADFLGEGKVK